MRRDWVCLALVLGLLLSACGSRGGPAADTAPMQEATGGEGTPTLQAIDSLPARRTPAEHLSELEQERARINLVRPFTWVGIGVGIWGASLFPLIEGARREVDECDPRDRELAMHGRGPADCPGRRLYWFGFVLGVVGGTTIGSALREGIPRLRRARALDREIEALRSVQPGITLSGPSVGYFGIGLSLKGKF